MYGGGAERAPPAPSKVVHISPVPPEAGFPDVAAPLLPYARPAFGLLMTPKRYALIELESLDDAVRLVEATRSRPFAVCNVPVRIVFSNSGELNRRTATPLSPAGVPVGAPPATSGSPAPSTVVGGGGGGRGSGGGSTVGGGGGSGRVLLIVVSKAIYPITTDVLDAILRPHGDLLRAVTFEKDGSVQALAEFRSPDQALSAMAALQGREIYDNCCALRIQVAHQEALNVRENSVRCRDWTNPGLPPNPAAVAPGGPAYALSGLVPPMGTARSAGGGGGFGGPPPPQQQQQQQQQFGGPRGMGPPLSERSISGGYGGGPSPSGGRGGYGPGGGGYGGPQQMQQQPPYQQQQQGYQQQQQQPQQQGYQQQQQPFFDSKRQRTDPDFGRGGPGGQQPLGYGGGGPQGGPQQRFGGPQQQQQQQQQQGGPGSYRGGPSPPPQQAGYGGPQQGYGGPQQGYGGPPLMGGGGGGYGGPMGGAPMGAPQGQQPQATESPVVMIYGLHHDLAASMLASGSAPPEATTGPNGAERVLAGRASGLKLGHDAIFNLVCPYGNVVKIKLLQKPLGGALVQMGDAGQAASLLGAFRPGGPSAPVPTPAPGTRAENASVAAFGGRIELVRSKQVTILPSSHGDDYVNLRDYAASPHNRFRRPGVSQGRYHPNAPAATLYFSNVPAALDEEALKAVFAKAGATAPAAVRWAPARDGAHGGSGGDAAASSGRRAGFADFTSVVAATEALMLANNAPFPGSEEAAPGPGTHLRLAFAARTSAVNAAGGGVAKSSAATPAAAAAAAGSSGEGGDVSGSDESGRKRAREPAADGESDSEKQAARAQPASSDDAIVEDDGSGAAPGGGAAAARDAPQPIEEDAPADAAVVAADQEAAAAPVDA